MSGIASIIPKEKLPNFIRIRQRFDGSRLSRKQIAGELAGQIRAKDLLARVGTGNRICITAGSRGIANITLILRTLADLVKEKGALPVILPAMGSHGGSTALGQKEILTSYGITEEALDCPILSSMETVQIGRAGGLPVFLDRYGAQSDGIIVVNRIKPHTGFRGPYESGLMKMMAVGLGKQKGASVCHGGGFAPMAERIPLIGREVLRKAPVLMGVGLVENADEETCRISVLAPGEIEAAEPDLLAEARSRMGRLYFDSCDILVVRQIGKNFSGDGMDPNVTGRFSSPYAGGGLSAKRVGILDLSQASHGNGTGMGKADIAARRFFEKLSFDATYSNFITTGVPFDYKMPIILDTDLEVFQALLCSCQGMDKQRPEIILINNSLELDRLLITPCLLEKCTDPDQVEVLSEEFGLTFDQKGSLMTEI